MVRTMSVTVTIPIRVTGDIEAHEDDAYFARVVQTYVGQLVHERGVLLSEDVPPCNHDRWSIHFPAERTRRTAMSNRQRKVQPEYRWAMIPEYGTKQFPKEWVEVKVLARTQCWAMCRRRDSPNAVPFVRAVKDLRDGEPKVQP